MRVRHYKGGIYEIVCRGRDSETTEPVVIYRNVADSRVWVRTAADFDAASGDWRRFTPMDDSPDLVATTAMPLKAP